MRQFSQGCSSRSTECQGVLPGTLNLNSMSVGEGHPCRFIESLAPLKSIATSQSLLKPDNLE